MHIHIGRTVRYALLALTLAAAAAFAQGVRFAPAARAGTPQTVISLSAWAQATWTTAAVPSGAVALSFGLNLGAVRSLTTDDYTMTGN